MRGEEDTAGPPARRFTPKRRQLYLKVLAATGNQRAAAAAAEIDRTTIQWRRRRERRFDAECRAAEAAAHAALGAARGAFEGVADGDFEAIRRGGNGRVQIVAIGSGRWSKGVEDEFIEVLARTGNFSAAARAVGFSQTQIRARRRKWSAFAERIDQALEDAEVALEFRLFAAANDVLGGAGEGEAGEGRETPFDPYFALSFLKWREQRKRGGGQRGRCLRREPTIEEVRDEIFQRIMALKREREQIEANRLRGEGEEGEGAPLPPEPQ